MYSKMRKVGLAVTAAALLGTVPLHASAQVRYDFTAFSSFPFGDKESDPPMVETFSGSFSVTLPGFVTTDTTLLPSELSSCTVVATPAADAACRQQEFRLDFGGYSLISFGVQTQLNSGTSIFYYFAEGAFTTPGTHDTVLLGQQQAGRLVVTAVPEPASWAILMVGLGALGLVARRRRTQA